jgi:hypothetical protein
MNINWLEPWKPIEDPDMAKVFEEELGREVAPDHPLAGLPLVAIGKHGNTDDYLFRVDDGSGRIALTHLTWSGTRESSPWPESMLFASEAEWIEHGMKPDHKETIEGK